MIGSDRQAWHYTTATQAVFRGCVSLSQWPIEVLRDALKLPQRGLRLIRETPLSTHPVIFLFGEHSNGAALLGGQRWGTSLSYKEALVVVPQLATEFADVPVALLLTAFCDYTPAVLVGRQYYGYEKLHAQLGWRGTSYGVFVDEQPVLLARVSADSRGASIDLIQSLLGGPIIGTADAGRIQSRWWLSFEHAVVRPATAAFTAPNSFIGLREWQAPSLVVRGLTWNLSWPRAGV